MDMKSRAWKVIAAAAILCALASEFFQHIARRTEKGQVEYAQEQIRGLELRMKESLSTIAAFTADSQYHEFFIHSGQQNQGFSFFYFENGKLLHWSDNETELPEHAAAAKINDGSVIHLPNGIFEGFEAASGNKKIIGLILLRRNFSYENRYLRNLFNPALGLDGQFQLAGSRGEYRLNSLSGQPLIALHYSKVVPDVLPFKTPAWFYLASFFLAGFALLVFFESRKTTLRRLVITSVSMFFIRWIMIAFHLPGELMYNDFFSPKIYGSSYLFNSLGDFFLNAFTFFIFSAITYAHFRAENSAVRSKAILMLLLVLLVILFIPMHDLINDLALNSKISFDAGIYDLNINTVVALLSILLMLWSYCLFSAALLMPFGKKAHSEKASIKSASFRYGLVAVILLSAYSSFVIEKKVSDRNLEDRKLFARRLDSRQDLLAEYLYTDLQERIRKDTLIHDFVTENEDVQEKISSYLQQNYFTGYFTKFNAGISVFTADTSSANALSDYRRQFAAGKQTTSENLVLLSDESGRLKYLSLLPVSDANGNVATIGVVLDARPSQTAEGFPELLVSNAVAKGRDEPAYSYARYSNGSLIYAGGNFPYAFHPGIFENSKEEFSSFFLDGYDHLVYRPAETSLIIVSSLSPDFLDRISFFSYILLLYLFTFLLAHIILYMFRNNARFPLTLKQRIRSSILALVVISFVLIGAGTRVYIISRYDADKNKNILSRLNAMWFALTDRMSFDKSLAASVPGGFSELNSLVTTFNIDFNLFDEQGNLVYSSQPKLFDKGILSKRINPEALYEMKQSGHTQFVHSESIGTLQYAAAYAPLTNREGTIVGYLNLPYFEKQNELNKEISGFFSALINIYLLLLIFAILLALIITSRITKPLLLIQEKLRSTRLGSRNETIEWSRNDEIGQLVKQYNMMVEALAESAARLAQSERETAWREMAQQVAHEIKNPLTPMKLSVQHLQRAWKEKSGNLDELFQRISSTMIEQIDTLSNIASAFSNFAKMPKAENEWLDLNDILRSSVNLFNDTPDVTIAFADDGRERKIFADRDQLMRVFSNILKNAVQAVPQTRKGDIRISVSSENDFHTVAVSDNGTGILPALQSKIFTPNFTTKTSGMGLGLAMVKSTLEAMGGNVRFETAEDKGTVFYITIPGAAKIS